ncbi:hypothetical protein [Aminobacter aminovorans]|uniref:Uncharacterized protein n=1 Tax=Aminobacter aminovorans TaxID=83263 RepID=A0AAC8YMU2_AMIAI|nr:hypothetical protein [Aminobacter aminovorans]AMS41223.1 hypothetical protein AA2016_2295 [Aminobacter aminovorans]MBB3705794.1 hypothetical protein [Aminobacter aminovorans]
MSVITPYLIRDDEEFQLALTRYHHFSGSSDAVAAAALRAMQPVFTAHNKRVTDLIEANNRYLQEARNWRIVEQLRAAEGHSVVIVNDNPDFNGQPGAFVECVGDWTGWDTQRFTGATIDEALGNAIVAFNKWSKTNV